ncbi:MAG: HAD-IA family hydrolase, partial [Firmicutes bacterium]|nr:HAD-IA family hydrolase [Bacillota bacterium]
EPLGVSMQKFFPEVPVEEAIEIYRSHQKDIFEEMIEPFPGMVELIKGLKARGYKVAITTSRLGNSTMVGLRKFGLDDVFDVIVTANDTTKHKPDPEPVLITLEKLGAKPEEALMIGDSMFDIKCAHNAGVKAVLVGWAEAVTEEDLNGPDRPDYFIETAEDLFDLV